MKFRKKTVVIEAFQYEGHFTVQARYLPSWLWSALASNEIYYDFTENGDLGLYIKTLEGRLHVSIDDYIIQGVQGELYPCNPDIFEQTYTIIQGGTNET